MGIVANAAFHHDEEDPQPTPSAAGQMLLSEGLMRQADAGRGGSAAEVGWADSTIDLSESPQGLHCHSALASGTLVPKDTRQQIQLSCGRAQVHSQPAAADSALCWDSKQ